MSVIDRATSHYAQQEKLIVTVPEWAEGDIRFDTDEMAISMDSFDAGNWSSIPLIEVRV